MLTSVQWCRCTILRQYGNPRTGDLLLTTLRTKRTKTTQHTKCPYQTLGIPRTASLEDIKQAYRTKAKLYHPDVNPDDGTMHTKFVEINDAYAYLTNKDQNVTTGARYSAYTYNKRYYGHDWWEEEKRYHRPTGKPFENSPSGTKNSFVKGLACIGFIHFVLIPFVWFDPLYLWTEEEEDWSYGPLPYIGDRFVANREKGTQKSLKPRRERPEGPRWHDGPRTQYGKKIKKSEGEA